MAHGVVDLKVFCPVQSKTELRCKLGLPLDRTVLLFAGYLIERKRPYELIEAFGQMRKGSPDTILVICGNGPEADRLNELIRQQSLQEVVRLVGQVAPTGMHEWMQASDVFVLPSYAEGMPNAVMEAMACGLPLISTTVGGLPGAVGDSDGAILVDPHSVDSLAEALLKVCSDNSLRHKMSLAARDTAATRFGVDHNARNTIAYFKRIIDGYKQRNC
jgi:teichuronic acid biosynthesis glycosyltransferase TuaC